VYIRVCRLLVFGLNSRMVNAFIKTNTWREVGNINYIKSFPTVFSVTTPAL
jgi:hypothetical protein